MKLFELNQPQTTHAVFSFGRLNPPHYGHHAMINTLQKVAKEKNGNWFLFVSSKQEPEKNPLNYEQKTSWIKALFPETVGHLVEDPTIKTPLVAATWLYKQGYRSITFVAGEDDMESYSKMIQSGNEHGKKNPDAVKQGKGFIFDPIDFAVSPRLASATNARAAVTSGDREAFARAILGPKITDPKLLDAVENKLYPTVRKAMNLGESKDNIIAENAKYNRIGKTPLELKIIDIAQKHKVSVAAVIQQTREGEYFEQKKNNIKNVIAARNIALDNLNKDFKYYWNLWHTLSETSKKKLLDKPTPTVGQLAEKYHTSLIAVEIELERGIKVEMEHTNDREVAREIALDHLNEKLDYYKKLAKVEEVAKVRISKDPNDYGAYVSDVGKPEPTVMLDIKKINQVLEPDNLHQTKPGAPEKISQMVKDIRKGDKLPPILVRRQGNGYQVLDGHHRFKAFKLAKVSKVPVRIINPKNIKILDEDKLSYKDPVERWISVFKASKHPKFQGKTPEQREKMARAAQLKAVQNKKVGESQPFDENIDETWTKKYKKSIDCNNPKGFSQRAHCAGRKARQSGKHTKSKSVSEGVKIDNANGAGQVPNNQNVDYLGLRVYVRPSKFLELAAKLDAPNNLKRMVDYVKKGGAIGAPFLDINIPAEWFDGDFSTPARISGHEGRHRMLAVGKAFGDEPVETHLFFRGGLRRRHLNDEIIKQLNKQIVAQDTNDIITGPWFAMSSQTESINEVANQPYRFLQTKKTATSNVYLFMNDAGSRFAVEVDYSPNSEMIEIGFADQTDKENPTIGLTGKGDAFRIFATVAAIVKEYMSKSTKPVNQITFKGKVKDPSRIKLYDAIARYLPKVMPEFELMGAGADSEEKQYFFKKTSITETLKKVKGKWALVSRRDPSKVLQYYKGSGHPSKEWVNKVERRVHSFSEAIDDNWFKDGFQTYKQPMPVKYETAKTDGTLQTLEGPVKYKAGYKIMTGPKGEQYPIPPEKFAELYDVAKDGTATPKKIIKVAKLADHDGVVNTSWGEPLNYTAGNDYIVRHGANDYGVVKKDIFAKTYIKEDSDEKVKPVVYLDMDGVLADFFGEWAKLDGKDHYKDIDNKEATLQMVREHPTFWVDLPLMPRARELIKLVLKNYGEYRICTKPLEGDPRCKEGKLQWIKNNLSDIPPKQVVFSYNKEEHAVKDGVPCVLVDDYGKNINAWRAAGGIGLKYETDNHDKVAEILVRLARSGVVK